LRFYRFISEKGIELAVEEDGNFISISKLLGKKSGELDLNDIIDNTAIIRDALKKKNYSYLDIEKPRYAPVVGKPQKIICVGLNYLSHIEETERKIPEFPVLFSKFNNSLTGHLEKIKLSGTDLNVDYEGELGFMISRKAYRVTNDFERYIFGYFIGNDLSARNLQYRTSQYLLGKTLDGFYPNGPFLATSDEIGDPQALNIVTKVNGTVRQNSNTSNMIFSINRLISYITSYLPLEAGDIISTGTPEGVIMGMKDSEKKWLSAGDEVEVTIEGLGTLKNSFY
jgi:2-keto-4-pentenoate hydratase/2-oxohepta-3-ene-1,7-dioic acid hydratase in catechol pathway